MFNLRPVVCVSVIKPNLADLGVVHKIIEMPKLQLPAGCMCHIVSLDRIVAFELINKKQSLSGCTAS